MDTVLMRTNSRRTTSSDSPRVARFVSAMIDPQFFFLRDSRNDTL
jgi:hypothetical protein